MVYKAKFDSTAFTSALTGDKQKESRRQFLMGVLGVLILFVMLPLAGIYIYFKSMEKDGVKAEFAIQSKLLYYRGMFTLPKADYISAEFQFREAYRLNPKDTKCLVGLGDAYMGQMRFKAALETYKKGVMEAKDPKAIELLQDRLNNFSIRKKELEKKGGTE
jgi:tetratricopeptide (TPR) repeat protein